MPPGHLSADASHGAGRSRQEGHHGQEVGVVRGRGQRGGANPGQEGAGPQVEGPKLGEIESVDYLLLSQT